MPLPLGDGSMMMVRSAGLEPACPKAAPLEDAASAFRHGDELVRAGRLELPKLRGLNAHRMPIPDKATLTQMVLSPGLEPGASAIPTRRPAQRATPAMKFTNGRSEPGQ